MVATSLGDFFYSFWWLLFPLAFFIAGGWGSFMRYKRSQAKIELLKTYAAAGKEPPAELIESLNRDSSDKDWHDMDERHSYSGSSGGGSTVFLVVLFAGFCGLFYFEAQVGWVGIGDVAYFIAAVMGVLAAAFLFSGLFSRKGRKGSGD